jgi:hypothetical protein
MINYILDSILLIGGALIFLLVLAIEFYIQYKILLYLSSNSTRDIDVMILFYFFISIPSSFGFSINLNCDYPGPLLNQIFMIIIFEIFLTTVTSILLIFNDYMDTSIKDKKRNIKSSIKIIIGLWIRRLYDFL